MSSCHSHVKLYRWRWEKSNHVFGVWHVRSVYKLLLAKDADNGWGNRQILCVTIGYVWGGWVGVKESESEG